MLSRYCELLLASTCLLHLMCKCSGCLYPHCILIKTFRTPVTTLSGSHGGGTATASAAASAADAVRRAPNTGVIVGGTVGGVVFLLVVFVGILFCIRRHRRQVKDRVDGSQWPSERAVHRDTYVDIIAAPDTLHVPASEPPAPETRTRLRDMFRLSLYKPQAYLSFESLAVPPPVARATDDQASGDNPPASDSQQPITGSPINQAELTAITRRLDRILARLTQTQADGRHHPSR